MGGVTGQCVGSAAAPPGHLRALWDGTNTEGRDGNLSRDEFYQWTFLSKAPYRRENQTLDSALLNSPVCRLDQ